jgi:nucleotide-binding universal stress UspA family protein
MSNTDDSNFRRILVAVDGSETSKKAAKIAAIIAKTSRAELTILHVSMLSVAYVAGNFDVGVGGQGDIKKEGEHILGSAVQAAESQGVSIKTILKEPVQSVAQTILQYAENEGVDLIVVGTRGLGGFKKLLLGSVASGLVHYSHCSVLIVK